MPTRKALPAEITKASRPEWAKELDDREYAFVCQYLVDLNAAKAAVRAGLAEDSEKGRFIAFDTKHRPHVARAIDLAIREDASGPRQWIVGKLSNIAKGNLLDLVSADGTISLAAAKRLPRELQKLVKRVSVGKDGEVKLELHDPVRAMELLAKIGGIQLTKSEGEFDGVTLEALIKAAHDMAEAKKGETK